MAADTVFVVVVLARFIVPLFIPRFPLPAVVACMLIDAADQTIFSWVTDDPLPGYQAYDKALDVYYLAIAYFSTMRNWRDPVASKTAQFLYIYRLVGVTLFELFHERWLLLVFANTFEYFFIAYEAVRTRWNPLRLTATAVVATAAAIWIFIKLPQEWWIHVAQLDFTEFMADHPYLWGVLFALAAIVAVVGWTQRDHIPTADWPFTMDVDQHVPRVDAPMTGREPFFSLLLAEKVVLMALISVIFAQVLPDIESSNLGVAVGVVVLVILNATISQALRRHGRSWVTTARQFVAMLVINVGIVTLDSVISGSSGDRMPARSTLFFALVLALLITLYDRYSTIRGTNFHARVWAAVRAERARAHASEAASGPAPAAPPSGPGILEGH